MKTGRTPQTRHRRVLPPTDPIVDYPRGSTRGGQFLATEAEYDGWGEARDHDHWLEVGMHPTRRP